ncbi:MAG: YajQ family cyclic di-GMP-binding protein [Phycisphaeraceae bacterium]|nr:YajQ family cyclic di-GMP-binding protein [Phycisphaeraceae bacterium]
MPSFDIVSRVDMQEVDNAVNIARKQLAGRYDFRGSKTEINFDRKEKKLGLLTEDKMKMEAIREMILQAMARRNVDIKALKFEEILPGRDTMVKRQIVIQEGLDQDTARAIVKLIKDAKMKVQASIQGDEVRVSGKKLDDLQTVMQMVRQAGLSVPLQFVNMQK